ncbi:MAG: response regulator [Cloacibacillus porcorum]|nr:response regulator [Cloacibacillus porcorum]
MAKKLLERKNITVDIAENGREALDKFRSAAPGFYDAILMDIRMPVMDGLEVTRLIRADERDDAKKIPIIAMSANAFDEDVRLSLDAGMDVHLSKPVEPQLLYETLEKFTKGRPS